MAVLDLETGKKVKDKPNIVTQREQVEQQAQAPQPIPQQQAPIQPQQAQQGVQNILAPALPESQAPGVRNILQPFEGREEPSFAGAGIIEPAASIVSGALAVPASGIGGTVGAAFTDTTAAENIKKIQEFLSIQPETPAGKKGLQTVGDLVQTGIDVANLPLSGLAGIVELATGQGFEQAGQTVEGIQGKDGFGKTLGQRALDETGSPVAAAFVETLPTAIMEIGPLKGLRATTRQSPKNVAQRTRLLEEQAATREARVASEATGIDLFKFQQTLNATDLDDARFLSSLPETANQARRVLSEQNTQAADAVNRFLNDLAPPSSVSDAAPKVRDAAQRIRAGKVETRKRTTDKVYRDAFKEATKEGIVVNIDPVKNFIKRKLDLLPTVGSNEMSSSLKSALDALTGKIKQEGSVKTKQDLALEQLFLRGKIKTVKGGKVEEVLSLKQLHNSRQIIADMISKRGSNPLGPTTKALLTEARDLLSKQMFEVSDLYKKANDDFSRLSGPIEKFDDSILGRISTFDDVQLRNVARDIFNPAETNPSIIRQAKTIIDQVSPDAWGAITRSEIQRRMGNIRADLESIPTGAVSENIPSQLFHSIYGKKSKRDVLFNALEGDAKKNFKYLETALRRSIKGRPGGSDTANKLGAESRLRQGIIRSIIEFIPSPLTKTSQIGSDAAFNRRAAALADTLFDPSFKSQMKEIRALPPGSEKARKKMDELLNLSLSLVPALIEGEIMVNGQQEQDQQTQQEQ